MFKWTEKTSKAAILLAEGKTEADTASEVGVTDRTIRNWKTEPEFSQEVDRLSYMVGIAARAERLRLANRIITKIGAETNKDLLDWLKYVQSETDGVKLDLTQTFLDHAAQVAGPGQGGTGEGPESDG